MKIRQIILCLSALMLTACAVGPDYQRPDFQSNDWLLEQGVNKPEALTRWWQVFEDPMLEELVNKVAQDNLDIAIAIARQRVLESRALYGTARSALSPRIGADGIAARNKLSLNNPNFIQVPGIDIPQIQDTYDLGFDASWEADIFGGNRRGVEAATARLQSTAALKRNITITVIAETARNYIELRGNQKRLALLQKNVELQRETLRLVTATYKSGLSRQADVSRSATQLANTQALLPGIEAQIRAGSYRLAVLTAQQPGVLLEKLSASVPLATPNEVVPVGLKSELLRRRPDIQIAERNLAAATADVGVAVAALYPSFSLTGSAGGFSDDAGNLLQSASETFLISPSVRFPIFEGGRLRAQIQAAEARNSIAAIEYEKTVLAALKETENALVRYVKEQETRARFKEAVQSSQRSVELVSVLYDKGLSALIDVLDVQRQLTVLLSARQWLMHNSLQHRARSTKPRANVMKDAANTLILSFETPELLNQWLAANHHCASELLVKIYKKASGVRSVTWQELVLESLCWGWIDGVKKSLDDQAYLQRITPRKPHSGWSKINTEHVERLIAAGRMQAPGLEQVRAAKEDGRWDNAYAPASQMKIPDDFLAAIEKDPSIKQFYASLNKSSLYAIAYGLETAKKPETRARRFNKFLLMLQQGEKPGFGFKKKQ